MAIVALLVARLGAAMHALHTRLTPQHYAFTMNMHNSHSLHSRDTFPTGMKSRL